MAVGTVTHVASAPNEGSLKMDRFTIVGVASYTTGGDTGLAAAIAALAAINDNRAPLCIVGQQDVTGYKVSYDKTTDKLIVMYYNTDAADGPAIEVPAATNLSGVTFDVWIISQ